MAQIFKATEVSLSFGGKSLGHVGDFIYNRLEENPDAKFEILTPRIPRTTFHFSCEMQLGPGSWEKIQRALKLPRRVLPVKTLWRRVCFNNRKGRSARKRLLKMAVPVLVKYADLSTHLEDDK